MAATKEDLATVPPKTDLPGETDAAEAGQDDLPVRSSSTSAGQSTQVKLPSLESLDAQKERELKECCREAFGKITEYVNGELSATLEDYALLEKLNQLTTTKYAEMSNMARVLTAAMEKLDEKYKTLQPYLEQINKVEESVASLEQAAYRLDAYSKKLETKFKKLERR